MAFPKLISLHPKLAAIIDAVFSLVLLWWINSLKAPWLIALWFAVRIAWWAVLVQVVYYPPHLSRFRHLLSLSIFNAGIVPYLLFSDFSIISLIRIFLVIIPLVSFWLVPSEEDALSVMIKPHRRWNFFMSVFGVSGVWLMLFAGSTFQIIYGWQIPVSIFLASVVTAAISWWEWNQYGIDFSRLLLGLSLIITIILLELGAIIFLWPIGYFVGSFFITWVWYLVWLMFRFYLSRDGINWSRQKFFLISNLFLMMIFLALIVRWK